MYDLEIEVEGITPYDVSGYDEEVTDFEPADVYKGDRLE